MVPWRGLRIAHIRVVPCGKSQTSTWGSAEGDGSVGDNALIREHASNSAADKLRPDISQDIFQQDEALAHTARQDQAVVPGQLL